MGKHYDPKKLPVGVNKKTMKRRRSAHASGAKQQKNTGAPAQAAASTSAAVTKKCARSDKTWIIGIRAAFYVLFFIIFNHLAFSLTAKFLELASMLGFTLTHMSVKSVPKLLRAAARYYRNELITSINDPNAGPIALMLDESTDVNSNKTLIVVLRMIRNNKPVELFHDNIVVIDTTAEGLANSLLEGLRKLDVDMELLKSKLISIGTDGASVMVGRLNGLHVQLQRAGYDKIVSVHCFAHRVDLVSKDAFNKHAAKNVQDVIQKCRQIAVAVNTSPKSKKIFSDCCAAFERKKRSIRMIEITRWLAHYERTITACADLRDPLVKFFEENPQYDKGGLGKFIASDEKYMLLCAVLEIVQIMAMLSCEFQRSDLTILDACRVLKNIEWQLKLRIQSGIRANAELGKRAIDMTVEDRGVQMQQLEIAVSSLQKLAENMLNNLQIRFSRKARTETRKVGRKTVEVVIEPDLVLKYAFALIDEWSVETKLLQEMCTFFKIDGVVNSENRERMLKQIMDLYPVLPPSTAECKRGFSQVKLIRTKFRNSLKAEVLSNLLLIKINSDNKLESAPVEQLTDEWCESVSKSQRERALKSHRQNRSPSLDDDDDDAKNNSSSENNEGGSEAESDEEDAEDGQQLCDSGEWYEQSGVNAVETINVGVNDETLFDTSNSTSESAAEI